MFSLCFVSSFLSLWTLHCYVHRSIVYILPTGYHTAHLQQAFAFFGWGILCWRFAYHLCALFFPNVLGDTWTNDLWEGIDYKLWTMDYGRMDGWWIEIRNIFSEGPLSPFAERYIPYSVFNILSSGDSMM